MGSSFFYKKSCLKKQLFDLSGLDESRSRKIVRSA